MLEPGTKLLQNRTQSTDHTGKLCTDSYDNSEPRNYGPRARKTAQNYTKYNSWNGMEVKFEPEMKAVDESGICSPPLWKTSPPRSPQHRANHYRSLSPTSRTQAIARGQRELMEMVKNMPEACYELSLKDIVEQPKVLEARGRESSVSEERDLNTEVLYKRENSKKRNDKRAQSQVVKRSASINNGGFYLKMVFPVSLGSKKNNNKKKKNDQSSVTNTSAKVSPKPIVQDGSSKGVDKEWWKKRISVSGESESGRSSSNSMKSTGSSSSSSSSSSRRSRSSNNRKKGGGCWSFIRNKKRQMLRIE